MKLIASILALVVVASHCEGQQKAGSPAADGTQTLESTCNILEHLSDFHGRVVTIRGRTYGMWIRVQECAAHIVVDTAEFPNMLALEWPDPILERYLHVPFPLHKPSVERLRQALNESDEVEATIEGMIFTRQPPYRLVVNGGKVGFGHLGAAPAAIVIKRVLSVKSIEPTSVRGERKVFRR